MKKLFLFLLVAFLFTGCQQDSSQLLQGKWQSLDDEKSSIEFSGDKKIDLYEGGKLSEGVFTLEKKEEGLYLSVKEGEETFEYKVDELSGANLNLIYLPRGNILRYER